MGRLGKVRQEMAQRCETGAGPAREETGDDIIVHSTRASGAAGSPPLQKGSQHQEGCV